MVVAAQEHVSWEEIVELARKIERGDADVASGMELARLVVRFQVETVGAPPKSSQVPRTGSPE